MCGGSIGSEKYIITAAHCKYNTNLIVIAYGTNEWKDNDNIAKPLKYTAHPNYNSRAIDFDYAYIELTDPLVFTDFIKPITIVPPNPNSKYNNQLYGDTAVTSGWGYSQHGPNGDPIVIPNELQKVELPLNPWETCTGFWGDSEKNPIIGRYTERMQCCGGQGATSCMGDSGGPLMVRVEGGYQLLGSVSWGSGKCDINTAGVYSNWAYPEGRQWIQDQTGL